VISSADARAQAPEGLKFTVADDWILRCPTSHDSIEIDAIATLTPRRWLARCPSCGAEHRIDGRRRQGYVPAGTGHIPGVPGHVASRLEV